VTLASSAASVTFSSIPATYRDLVLVMSGTTSVGATDVSLRFNSDTGSNYSRVVMYGLSGSAASTSSTNTSLFIGNNQTTSQFNVVASIMDYSAADKHKTVLSRSNQADGLVGAWAGRWANTAAITSVEARVAVTFVAGTTLSLYGVIA